MFYEIIQTGFYYKHYKGKLDSIINLNVLRKNNENGINIYEQSNIMLNEAYALCHDEIKFLL